MEKCIVTGGAGFIGSHLIDKLIDKGNSVTAYDNLSSGKKQFIERHLDKNNFTFVEADLLDLERVKKEIKELEILGDGNQQKPYLHVSDVVDGMLFGFEHSNDQINLFNLGCDSNTTVTRIAEMVIDEMGLKNVRFKYTGGKRGWKGDVPRFQLDVSKIKKLGWKERYTSDETLRKAIKEILNNP